MSNVLKYKGYLGAVEYSAEDEVFFGKIHGITDLVTFEANTAKEIKKSFEQAVDEYLAMCTQFNKDPSKAFKGSFNVRISPETHRTAALVAAEFDLSLNDLVAKAIKYAISHKETLTEV